MKQIGLPLVCAIVILAAGAVAGEEIQLLRTPTDGIQPQAAIDDRGNLHLIYFSGDPKRGNLYYVTRAPGAPEWSDPRRVNSERGSARRNGAISHAQLALGARGRVHVSWFNMQPPRYFYSRTRDDGRGFEDQRNLVTEHVEGVETGASVAADGTGNVAIVWHAGSVDEEDKRGVYSVISRDGGRTFGPESRIDDDRGVCACCGLTATWSREGALYVIYRAATDFVHRDMILLKSVDDAKTFTPTRIHEWNIGACPVSTTRVTTSRNHAALLAWETKGRVFVAEASAGTPRVIPAPGATAERRKNPVAIMNRAGETLLVWGDGPGWRSGGTLHWQVFDAEWNTTDLKGHAGDIAEYSVPTAVARPDGTFVVIY